MKRFLLKTIYFLAPVIILLYPLDYCISYFLKRSNQDPGEYEVMNDIYSSKINCDVAVYGSSRAWVHIDPKTLTDSLHLTAYNFGVSGHNFWIQYLRHLEFLKHNRAPKHIIFSADIFSLQKRVDLYYADQFLPYMLWNKNIREYTSCYIGYSSSDYYVPLIRYAGKFDALRTSIQMFLHGPPVNRYRQNGYLGMDLEWNSDFDNAKAKNESYTIHFDHKSIDLLEKFIQECKQMNINLVFVYTPEYIEGQKMVSNRAEAIALYKRLTVKYHLPFYDYSGDGICSDKTYFYNANHLNKKGAEAFSRKLAHDIKSSIPVGPE